MKGSAIVALILLIGFNEPLQAKKVASKRAVGVPGADIPAPIPGLKVAKPYVYAHPPINGVKILRSKLSPELDHKKLRRMLDQPVSKDGQSRCAPVDLTEEMGPVRNQQKFGWCYAFTAADVIGQAMKQEVSALQLAHEFQKNDVSQNLSWENGQNTGAPVIEAMRSLQSRGKFCKESELRSSDIVNTAVKGHSEKINKMGDKFSFVILGDLRKEVSRVVAESDIGRMCQHSMPAMEITENRTGILESINRSLDDNRIAGFTYLMDLVGVDLGYHASSIVGRKMIGDKCHYLIRNSWGKSCRFYPEPHRSNCKDGNIWVSSDELVKNTYSTVTAKVKSGSKTEKVESNITEGVQ